MVYEQFISGECQEQFKRDGISIIKNFLSDIEASKTIELIHHHLEHSGINRYEKKNLIGAMVKNRVIWPMIFQKKLIDSLQLLCPEGVTFAEEEQLAIGPTQTGWHRDTGFINGRKDWSVPALHKQGYLRLRVLRYFQETNHSPNIFSFKPGTQDGSDGPQKTIEMGPRDILIFNASLLHRGHAPSSGMTKYMFTSTYSNKSDTSKEIYIHNSKIRFNEGYYNMPDELLKILAEKNIAPLSFEEKIILDQEVTKQTLCVMQAHHPHWQGRIHFYSNGTFARPGIDSGIYEWVKYDRLILNWQKWPAETLFWDDTNKRYYDPQKGFSLSEI